MERMFESVVNSAVTGAPPTPLIIATPQQLAAVLAALSPEAFAGLMLILTHGFSEEGRVEVLGWGSPWLRDHGMSKYAAERAAAELRDKGYVRREQGPGGPLGKTLGIVPAGIFTDAPDAIGIVRSDGRPRAYGRKSNGGVPSTVSVTSSRCRVCNGIKQKNPASGKVTYAIERSGYVKIGTTKSLSTRLASLAGRAAGGTSVPDDFDFSSPLRLIGTTTEDEHALHERFASRHATGEWFRPNQRMMRALSDLVFADLSV